MPKGNKVHRCVQHVMDDGKEKGSAIAICQSSTGLSYATGKKPKKKFKEFVRERDNDMCYSWSEYNCPFCDGTAYNGEPYFYTPKGPLWFRGSAKCQDCNESFSAIKMEPKGKLIIEKKKWKLKVFNIQDDTLGQV